MKFDLQLGEKKEYPHSHKAKIRLQHKLLNNVLFITNIFSSSYGMWVTLHLSCYQSTEATLGRLVATTAAGHC